MVSSHIPNSNTQVSRAELTGALVLCCVVAVVFAQAIFCDFVGWDDALFITSNPRFNPATFNTLSFYWTHAGFNLYMPITYSLWAAVAKVAELPSADSAGNRLNPFVFHLLGLSCHLITSVAVYGILLKLVTEVAPATLGAIAFAIHPLMCEPVAFIGTMNTPIAAAFALPAVWLYLTGGRWRPLIGLCLYTLSLLAKPTTVTIPLLLICLDIFAFHHQPHRAVRHILPWILITLPCLVWTRMIQTANHIPALSLWSRLCIAGDAVSFYAGKIIYPVSLTVDYGRTPAWIVAHHTTATACLVPVTLLLIAWLARRKWLLLSLAVVLFLILLLPNLGLISFDYQRVSNAADRYAYLALFAVALAIASALTYLPVGLARRVGYATAISLLLAWAVITTMQLRIWRNGVTLFTHAVQVNPQSVYCYQCLAQANLAADDAPAALNAATKAIALNPIGSPFDGATPPPGMQSAWAEAAQAHIARGNALDRLNRVGEAANEFKLALQLNPGSTVAAKDLAIMRDRRK